MIHKKFLKSFSSIICSFLLLDISVRLAPPLRIRNDDGEGGAGRVGTVVHIALAACLDLDADVLVVALLHNAHPLLGLVILFVAATEINGLSTANFTLES